MGNLCGTLDSEPSGKGGAMASGGVQMNSGGAYKGSDPNWLAKALQSHYAGTDVRYFVAHLVNKDLSRARPVVVELGPAGIALAHPKPPFQHFKTFDLDEIVGWKATEAEFRFVSLRDGRGNTQEWSIATDAGSSMVGVLDAASKSFAALAEQQEYSGKSPMLTGVAGV